MEEELLFAGSGSRLDYFKAAIDYEARLRIKKLQLGLTTATAAEQSGGAGGTVGTTRIAVSVDGESIKRERPDGEQNEKESRDKKVEEEPGADEDEGDVAVEAVGMDSEPTSKKQRS